jgi:hypothetical protein
MEKCSVFFAVRSEFLNITKMSFGFKVLIQKYEVYFLRSQLGYVSGRVGIAPRILNFGSRSV